MNAIIEEKIRSRVIYVIDRDIIPMVYCGDLERHE